MEVAPVGVIRFEPGRVLVAGDRAVRVLGPARAEHVLVEDMASGDLDIVRIDGLRLPDQAAAPAQDLAAIPEQDWGAAKRRQLIVRKVLDREGITRSVRELAKDEGVHFTTVYRWLRRYRNNMAVTALFDEKRGVKPGSRKLDGAVENLVAGVIQDLYLKDQKRNVVACYRQLEIRCIDAGVRPPHVNTFRARIRELDAPRAVRKRQGVGAERKRFGVSAGSADAPFRLSVVQIDHTPLDLIIVDDVHRLPIGRPHLTLVFDLRTRAVTGHCLALENPGALAAGLAITQSVLPKDALLEHLGCCHPWPVMGLPESLHMDNAKEFRGEMLALACEEYGIEKMWRPVEKPNWGGHIERALGTLAGRLKEVPGATFSNPEERGEYDSEARAALTLRETERWLMEVICGDYHNEIHSEIGMPPIVAWRKDAEGGADHPACGLPRMPSDAGRFRLDFLPFREAQVEEYGVRWDWVEYRSDVLRAFRDARDPKNRRLPRKFLIRRDPRDISVVYFWDPDNRVYHPIPYGDPGWPPMSIWEFQAIRRRMRAEGQDARDMDAIVRARRNQNSIIEQAQKETKRVRREAQKKRNSAGIHAAASDAAASQPGAYPEDADEGPVVPFDAEY